MMMMLAEITPEEQQQMLIWGGVIMLVAIMGCGAIMVLKRRLSETGEEDHVPGFSLSELRAMRDRGEITSAEYEQTKARVIAKVKAKADQPRKPKPPRLEDEETDFGS